MPTGSGLDAQVGFKAETTWGTAVTVDKFIELKGESLKRVPTFLEPTALRVGTKFKRASRVKVSRSTVNGDLNVEFATKGMLTLLKHMLGATISAPTVIAGSAYKSIFTPGGFVGFGLTVQVGRPEPSGTVRAHTYAGCKVTGWEFSLSDGEIPGLKLSFDGKSESTATGLATASYVAGATVFDFSQAVLKLGGTASTTGGETSISGGVAVTTIIKSMSITGATPMATERFGIGNAGLKGEPLENDTPTITGSLAAEFNKTELYDVFTANTTTAIELTFTGGAIPSGSGNNYLLSFIMPACKFKAANPTVDGPDIVQMSTDFEAYNNEVDPTLQIKVQSDESAL